MEEICIKDFVGIEDITLEIKRINILIGPQASGKSIIAKLLFYFKGFTLDILNSAERGKTKKDLDKDLKKKFEEYFPSSAWGDKEFEIRYSIAQEFIEVTRRKNLNRGSSEVVLSYSAFYKNAFTELKSLIKKRNEKIAEEDIKAGLITRLDLDLIYGARPLFLQNVTKKLSRTAAFSQLFIPAGRSFFANLRSSIFAFLSENNAVDPFLIEFGTYYDNIKSPLRLDRLRRSPKNKNLHEEITSLNKKILCGRYFQEDGEDYLEVDDDRKIRIANASSGQQETLPLAIILGTISFLRPEIGGDSIYIEEPEAHIFPTAQKNMVELIATVYNSRKESLQFLITTHSPYVLTAFNNLIQAGLVSFDATKERIEQISHHVPKSRFLYSDEIAVYSLSDGYCKSIVDTETGLINTNIIDEVSTELAVQFDRLLDFDS